MPRLMVEMRSAGESDRSMREMISALEQVGAEPVAGYDPVAMAATESSSASFILTVDVPDAEVARRIEALPCVVQVYGDTPIAPFGG